MLYLVIVMLCSGNGIHYHLSYIVIRRDHRVISYVQMLQQQLRATEGHAVCG